MARWPDYGTEFKDSNTSEQISAGDAQLMRDAAVVFGGVNRLRVAGCKHDQATFTYEDSGVSCRQCEARWRERIYGPESAPVVGHARGLVEAAEANQKTVAPKHWIDEKIAADCLAQERLDLLFDFSDAELLEELRRRLEDAE